MHLLISTDVPIAAGGYPAGELALGRQGERRRFKPVVVDKKTTRAGEFDLLGPTAHAGEPGLQRRYDPPSVKYLYPPMVEATSTPLQIWEGTVLEVDHNTRTMHVLLDAKIGQMPRHTGEIELEWVSEQDQDLVRPGAVFYLTLFKRTTHGSIENAQELRFRRRPSWTAAQLRQIEDDAALLVSKMRPLPTAA